MPKEIPDNFDFNMDIDLDDFAPDMDIQIEEDESLIRYIKPPVKRYLMEKNLKYENAEKLAREINIQKDERYFIVIDGSFIFGDFIEALIIEHKYDVKELTLSTLSLSENNVDSFAGLMNLGFIKKLNIIVSDYFFSHERKNLIPYLYKELDKKNRFQLAVAGTHCKLAIMELKSGLKIVIHGSANLRSSGNIEQFMIEESSQLYDFNYEFQAKIIDKYKTIAKAVRNKELWRTIKD